MKSRLTDKQKVALWGLIKYPSLNDRETSDKIKMKLSTLTTIRYKMLNDGYYRTVNIPISNRMSFEACAFFILRLDPNAKGKPLVLRKGDYPNLVFMAHDQNRLMAFGFYESYAKAEADLHSIVAKMAKSKSIARSGHWWKVLPFGNYDIPIYFDMSTFVNIGLKLNRPGSMSTKGSIFKGKSIHLSSFERKVLEELVYLPDDTDVQISKNLGITRSTVARIRERLLGLAYKTLNIVDLKKVGFKAISIAAPTLNYTFNGTRAAISKAAMSIGTPLFLGIGDFGAVFMNAHQDLKGIRSKTNNVFKSNPFKRYIRDPTHIATFNLKQLTMLRDHDYLPLVRQILKNYEYRPRKRVKRKKGK